MRFIIELKGEIGCQHVNAAFISPFMILPHATNLPMNACEQDRPPHQGLRPLLFWSRDVDSNVPY